MASDNEDDKPTVVLDLNALKKQGFKASDDLTSAGRNLNEMMGPIEFNIHSEAPAEAQEDEATVVRKVGRCEIILFDYQSSFFMTHKTSLPDGFDYTFAKTLPELNAALADKEFKILAFNYEEQPKVVNQLSAQIKQKFPHIKILIMAKSISPEKARVHAQTPSGAHGYYQFPLLTDKLDAQFMRLKNGSKKV